MDMKKDLISIYDSSIKDTDPDLAIILDNFISKQVLENSILSDRERIIVTLACLIANQSVNLYEKLLNVALDIGVTPVEIKEIIYQSLAYIGLSKTYDFINKSNEIFVANSITLPLESQTTVDHDKRLQVGYDLQVRNFGKNFIDNSIDSCPEDQKHIWDFISSYAFGDFYTRTGLNDVDRELISFTFILSLGGCENQLRIHTKGNIKIGNSKEKLISVITVLVPYIGFPRVHNALAIINEVFDSLK